MRQLISRKKYQLEVESKSRLLPSLAFSNTDSSPSKLCVLCAEFKIIAEALKYEEDVAAVGHYAAHRAYRPYEDVYPDFPDLEKRAADGCDFCAFLRNSLPSEYRKSTGRFGISKTSVWLILSTIIIEEMYDESTLSVYKRDEPHTLHVQVLRRHSTNAEERDLIFSQNMGSNDGPKLEGVLNYKIAFQISSGTYLNKEILYDCKVIDRNKNLPSQRRTHSEKTI